MNIVSKGNYHHETQAKRIWCVFLGFKVRVATKMKGKKRLRVLLGITLPSLSGGGALYFIFFGYGIKKCTSDSIKPLKCSETIQGGYSVNNC
jgi:hypothetical protein